MGTTNRRITAQTITNGANTLTLPAATDTLVGRTTTDTLTNKTLTAPVITTPSIDVPSLTDQGSTPSTPSAGITKVYTKTTGKVYKLNSAGTETEIGSGGGAGGKNYLADLFSGESVAGISTYKDASATTPADGTGGTAVVVGAATLNTTTELRGTSSQRLPKGAGDGKGEGWAIPITTELADYEGSKNLILSFSYKTSANYASGDIRFFAYDVTNSVLINLMSLTNDGSLNASTTATRFVGQFQAVSTSASYRLIAHVTSVNALAYDVDVIDLSLSPSQTVPGAIIQDLGTETWVDSETNSTTSVRLRRVGNEIYASGLTTVTGVFSGSNFDITIPAAYTAGGYTFAASQDYPAGLANMFDATGSSYPSRVRLTSATNLRIQAYNAASTYTVYQAATATTPFTWASGDYIEFEASWIVSGWLASAGLSTTETMLVSAKARYYKTAAQSITAATATILDASTLSYDTISSVTTGASWKFTPRKTAVYRVKAYTQYVSRTYANGNLVLTQLFKNGSYYSQGGFWEADGTPSLAVGSDFEDSILLTPSDYIDIRAYNAGSVSTNTDGIVITVEEVPDFSIFSVYGETALYPTTGYSSGGDVTYTTTAGDIGDLASVTLQPGEYDAFAQANFNSNGATTTTNVAIGITTTAGNSVTGRIYGETFVYCVKDTGSTTRNTLNLNMMGIVVTTPTTYYFKSQALGSITNLQVAWAWRFRKIK